MREQEKFESVEQLTAARPERSRSDEISVNGSAAVESLVKIQEQLFGAAEHYLPAVLLERLRRKAEREQELLAQSFEREQQITDAAKKAVHVLNAAFFRIIKMEPHIFD